jgi:hypothetical protein
MKNSLIFMFLLLLTANTEGVFAQRGGSGKGTIPKVDLVPVITHATCFDATAEINYSIVISTGWTRETRLNRLDLYDADWSFVESLTGNGGSGTITDLPVGMYNFYGSMTVQTSTGIYVSVIINQPVWVGIETVWTEKIDMITTPNSYSAQRNASTTSYGGVRSSNGITSGDGWIEMSAVFGSTNDNRVFLMIGETNPLGTFNPSSIFQQYIEFYTGSGGNGIRVWYNDQVGGILGNYYTSISTDPNDKIRLVRTGSSLTIQKNSSNSTVFTLPQPYSGPMNIAVRTLAEDDGCLDVVSTFECRSEVYAKMERKLRGVKYEPIGNSLKFYVTEEYNNQSGSLNYNVYADGDRTNPVLSGTQQVHSLVYGDNRYNLDVISLSNGSYILEVINDKKEKFYLRFIK